MSDKKLMRIIGLDIGSRYIGVAVSDELGMTAQGLKTITRRSMEDDLMEISLIITQFKEIDKIVVGLPKNMDGTIGKQAEMIFKWIRAAQEKIPLPFLTWDERLSTVEVTKILLEADLSRKKRKRVIDKLAAALILQGYLNQSRKENDEPLPPT